VALGRSRFLNLGRRREGTPSDPPKETERKDQGQPVGTAEVDRESLELMAAVRDGDVQAFEQVVERYWARTLLYTQQLTGDRDRALDVAQEAFARLWKKRMDWVPTGSVKAWLFCTSRNIVLSEQRKANVRSAWARRVVWETHRSPITPLQEAEQGELRTAILKAVERLSPRRREAFTLFHLQGLSYREAAEIMEVREQTVANYLQAAIAELRLSLRPFLSAPGEGLREEARTRYGTGE
jgi:RNA polymerase sigma-70 factor, ECF subfamily